MGSHAMICIPSFINIGSVFQKLIRVYRDAQTEGDLMSILLFFRNKESMLNILHTDEQLKKVISGAAIDFTEDILATVG
jgi:hypothetical protein